MPTMCKIHKDYRGFRAILLASNFSCNLISLKYAIPYEIIYSTLVANEITFHDKENGKEIIEWS